MITAFAYGLIVAAASTVVGETAWRRLPAALAGLPGLVGAGCVLAAVRLVGPLDPHLTGYGVAALVFGLVLGGQAGRSAGDRLTGHRTDADGAGRD